MRFDPLKRELIESSSSRFGLHQHLVWTLVVQILTHRLKTFRAILLLSGLLSLGCQHGLFNRYQQEIDQHSEDIDYSGSEPNYKQVTYQPHDAAAEADVYWEPDDVLTEEPWSLEHELPQEYLDLTIEQVLQIALENATILSDLGGTILTAPLRMPSRLDPEVVETDPQFGVEATLSQFDARVRSIGQFQNNDRPFNNFFVGGGTQLFRQDYHDYLLELSKKTATGAEFSARNIFDYDANNRAQNLFPSAWETKIEMEVRQPLLQGAGVDFNRIAGPNGRPGALQGIVIARINTDIAITEFEMGLRDFISNVENAYWDLYYAYRLLDTSLDARDQSLRTWKATISQIDQKGITAAKEAQAREQYFRFEEDVQNALAGRTRNATQTRNGSQPGTFVGAGGLYVAERRLRLIMGLPIKGQSVIRPTSEPKLSPTYYEWASLVNEAMTQRPELKKQRQVLKSLELQREVSKDFTKPRLDAFGRYRFRGLGDNLFGSSNAYSNSNLDRGAYEELFHGNFQEWELGLEMTVPLGFRQGHAAVRNLELQIARARATLHQQERQIAHDLSNALAELRRVQKVNEISYNRLVSAQQRFSSLHEDIDTPDEILDAQVRLAEAKSNYYRTLVEHESALRNIHYEKGSLLPFRNVILSDHYIDQENTYWENCPPEQDELARVTSGTMLSELPKAETESSAVDAVELDPSIEDAVPVQPPQISLPPLQRSEEPIGEESVEYFPHAPLQPPKSPAVSLDVLENDPIPLPPVTHLPERADESRVVEAVKQLPFIELEQESPVRFVSKTGTPPKVNKLPPLPVEDDEWQSAEAIADDADTSPRR